MIAKAYDKKVYPCTVFCDLDLSALILKTIIFGNLCARFDKIRNTVSSPS